MVLGNLSRQVGDYKSAADFYEDCAEYYLKAEPIEYKGPSAMFLLRTAEMNRLMKKYEKSERVVILGVLRLNSDSIEFQVEENKAIKYIKGGTDKYKDAIPIYKKLIDYFMKSLDKLEDIGKEIPGLKETAVFAKTRLIHIVSEYRMILMFCLYSIGKKEESKKYALESIDHLNTAIKILKDMIIKENWNRTDLKRLTYISFMRAYFQKYHHIKNPKPKDQIQDYIIEGLPESAIESIKKLPYYDLCIKTEKYTLKDLDEELKEYDLGRMQKYSMLFQSHED